MRVHRSARNALTTLAAVAALGTAGPVLARTIQTDGPPPGDSVVAWGEMHAPQSEFFLNSDRNMEVIRFSREHQNSVCVPRDRSGIVDEAIHAVALKAMWNGRDAVIDPGHCMTIDAKVIRVEPVVPLPDDLVLEGRIKTTG